MFTSFQSGRCPMSLSEQYYWHHSPYKIQVHCSKEAQASICCRQALGKCLLTFLLVLLFFECLYQQVGNSCHPFSIKSHNLHFISFWLSCQWLLFNNGSFSDDMLFLPRIYIKVVIIYINIRLWYFLPLSLPIKMLVQSNNEVIET